MATLTGYRLKYNAENARHGIYFIGDNSTESRVEVVGYNKPGRLMFIIPTALVSGDYVVEVRNEMCGASIRV
jgi:hypothetical protein